MAWPPFHLAFCITVLRSVASVSGKQEGPRRPRCRRQAPIVPSTVLDVPAPEVKFYRLLTKKPEARCGIAPSDVVISLVVNDDEDWSFEHGSAQFLTGEP